jgi:hypothetical protein
MGYFDRKEFVSNSDLTALKKTLSLAPERDLSHAFAMGSLVDAHLTEETEIATYEAKVSQDDAATARLMALAGNADETMQLYLQDAKLQHEFYRNALPISYEGFEFTLPFRGKLDILKKLLRAGADIKTTACTSLPAFVSSIDFLDYDRQGVVYMDGCNLDYFMFIGISKTKNKITRKHDVFKFAMKRGDATYNRGKAKFNFLAFQYYFLVHSLKLQ